MFRRLPDAGGEPLHFTFDGMGLVGRVGDTVATALLANGILTCRTTPVSGAPRAPYCLMGVCFECLVLIDGTGSRQACLVPLAEGMRVETQEGVPPSRPASPGPEGRAESAKPTGVGSPTSTHPPRPAVPSPVHASRDSVLPSGPGEAGREGGAG